MNTEVIDKVSRIPRNYDAIEKGALALELKDRVELRKKLTESIDEEVRELKEKFESAHELVNGKKEGL